MTSAANVSPSSSATVRQQPLTEIESPCAASDVTKGPRMVSRTASPSCFSAVTVPFSSTIPVNIRSSPPPVRRPVSR